jgi:hypothetical protein
MRQFSEKLNILMRKAVESWILLTETTHEPSNWLEK